MKWIYLVLHRLYLRDQDSPNALVEYAFTCLMTLNLPYHSIVQHSTAQHSIQSYLAQCYQARDPKCFKRRKPKGRSTGKQREDSPCVIETKRYVRSTGKNWFRDFSTITRIFPRVSTFVLAAKKIQEIQFHLVFRFSLILL